MSPPPLDAKTTDLMIDLPNFAPQAGALLYDANPGGGSGHVTIRNCVLQNNVAHGNGVSTSADGIVANIKDSTLSFISQAGAVSIRNGAEAYLISCIFQNNHAVGGSWGSGGALAIGANTEVVMTNCTFFGNTAVRSHGAIVKWYSSSTLTVTDNLTRVFENTPSQTCPAGHYVAGFSNVSLCPSSWCAPTNYDGKYDANTTCAACPAGKNTPGPGYFACASCPRGRYQDELGSQGCKLCPPGRYQDESGSQGCKLCPPGTFGGELCKRQTLWKIPNSRASNRQCLRDAVYALPRGELPNRDRKVC